MAKFYFTHWVPPGIYEFILRSLPSWRLRRAAVYGNEGAILNAFTFTIQGVLDSLLKEIDQKLAPYCPTKNPTVLAIRCDRKPLLE